MKSTNRPHSVVSVMLHEAGLEACMLRLKVLPASILCWDALPLIAASHQHGESQRMRSSPISGFELRSGMDTGDPNSPWLRMAEGTLREG